MQKKKITVGYIQAASDVFNNTAGLTYWPTILLKQSLPALLS
jgi:hypothetical protein